MNRFPIFRPQWKTDGPMFKKAAILFIPALITAVIADPLLTPEDAVSLALKNSYGILVARNDADIARVNNTLGNAGLLPTAAATGAATRSNASSTTLSAGAALSWTLFDGGKMFVTKARLSHIQALGEIQFRAQVLETQYDVTAAYYDVVREKQQERSLNEVIAYNKERVKILQAGFNAGSSLKSALLQAQIDLNVYEENALSQATSVRSAKRALNQLLAREPETPFEVADTIPLGYTPDRKALLRSLDSCNTSIQAFQQQVEIARKVLSENRALYWPKITLSAGYSIQEKGNAAGTVRQGLSSGPQIGGNVTLPLFQAGNAARQVETAKFQLRSAEENLEGVRLKARSDLMDMMEEYESQEAALAIELRNAALAKENLDIAMNRLRLGQSTSLELKLAEDSYSDSQTRLVNFTYNLKITETKLKQLVAGM